MGRLGKMVQDRCRPMQNSGRFELLYLMNEDPLYSTSTYGTSTVKGEYGHVISAHLPKK